MTQPPSEPRELCYNIVPMASASQNVILTKPTPFNEYWTAKLSVNIWAALDRWYQRFKTSDTGPLIQLTLDRECERGDISPEIWSAFLKELLINVQEDSFVSVNAVLAADFQHKRYFLPGLPVKPKAPSLFRYTPLDRLNEQALGLPIGGEVTLGRLSDLIKSGRCTGRHMIGGSVGDSRYPVWITDDSCAAESSGDCVRNKLGLRHIYRDGQILAEVRYPIAVLQRKGIDIKAPTALDAWRYGVEGSWVFRKLKHQSGGPEWGNTVNLSSGGSGQKGVPEAVHESFVVEPTEGDDLTLRVLEPITGPPPEMSLYAMAQEQSY